MKPPVERESVPRLTEELVTLRSPRFVLCLVRDDDAESLYAHAKDPELPRMMTWAAHASIDETRTVIRNQRAAFEKQTDIMWMIEIDGAIMGTIGLHQIKWGDRALRRDNAMIGYWVAPVMRNRGIVTETVRVVLAFAFATLGLHKVNVMCFGGNDPSRRVIEKCGFRFVGIAREDVWRDEQWHDHLKYEMTITDWGG